MLLLTSMAGAGRIFPPAQLRLAAKLFGRFHLRFMELLPFPHQCSPLPLSPFPGLFHVEKALHPPLRRPSLVDHFVYHCQQLRVTDRSQRLIPLEQHIPEPGQHGIIDTVNPAAL